MEDIVRNSANNLMMDLSDEQIYNISRELIKSGGKYEKFVFEMEDLIFEAKKVRFRRK